MALIWIILACFPVEGKFRAEEIRIDKFLGARRARCKMYVDHFAMRPLRPITESVLQQTILWFFAQDAGGIEHREDRYTDVGKHCRPHTGKAHCAKHKDDTLYDERKGNIEPSNPHAAAEESDRLRQLGVLVVCQDNVARFDTYLSGPPGFPPAP